MRDAANGLMSSNVQAPQMQAARAEHTSAVGAFGAPVLWNVGEQYKAPDAMQAAQMGAVPQMSAATVQQPQAMQATMAGGVKVNAPSQNSLDLKGAYDGFIHGDRGNNPFLTGGIAKGINQSKNAFDAMVTDALSATQDVLAGIRSNSVLSGMYGGNRQGIAEGKAIESMNQNLARAASQFGQNNTDAAVAAQAGAYETDSNRALSATQGLGAQQYGVAQQDAAMAQQTQLANQQAANQAAQTNFGGLLSGAMADAGYAQQAGLANQQAGLTQAATNAGLLQDAAKTNYGGQLSVNAGNAGLLQQANLANQQAGNVASMFGATQTQNADIHNANNRQQTNQFNAGLLQQAGQTNLQAQLGTNQLNSANRTAGIGAQQGLLGMAQAGAQTQDNYQANRLGQVNSLLSPYTTGQNVPFQPVYNNTASAGLGGAMAGLSLFNMFNQANRPQTDVRNAPFGNTVSGSFGVA
jgi:hypothetical protein